MLKYLRGGAAVVALALIAIAGRADAPRTLTFQGMLGAADGTPQPDGDYTVTFRLHDALVDGTLLWTEADRVVTVAGGQGRFTVLLGEPTPFGALAFDVPYFLEVEVAGEGAPMTPRIPLSSAPYALNTGGPATLSLPFEGSLATDDSIGIKVENTGSGGIGVRSITHSGRAFWGTTDGSYAVYAEALAGGIGVQGVAVSNVGVIGYSTSSSGVAGVSTTGNGVNGVVNGAGGFAVLAQAGPGSSAVRATSSSGRAIWATCNGASYGAFIENTGTGIGANVLAVAGIGVAGNSVNNIGIYGHSGSSHGVYGLADNNGIGVFGESANFEGVRGTSHNVNHGGVVGINTTSGAAIYGVSTGGGYAGYFDGRVRVAVLEIAGGADLAERFETSEDAEPGTVMCIDPETAGKLRVSDGAYNRTVAGVVSGANNLSAGMVLSDPAAASGGLVVAMTGRVWVKCDAANGPIQPGDMLTTSKTAGHAMRVSDYARSQGATLGKAMTSLESGSGLVLALVSLQ